MGREGNGASAEESPREGPERADVSAGWAPSVELCKVQAVRIRDDVLLRPIAAASSAVKQLGGPVSRGHQIPKKKLTGESLPGDDLSWLARDVRTRPGRTKPIAKEEENRPRGVQGRLEKRLSTRPSQQPFPYSPTSSST